MKRLISLLLIAMIGSTLFACGKQPDEPLERLTPEEIALLREQYPYVKESSSVSTSGLGLYSRNSDIGDLMSLRYLLGIILHVEVTGEMIHHMYEGKQLRLSNTVILRG